MRRYIIFIVLALLTPFISWAQHHIGFSVDASMAWEFDNAVVTQTTLGARGGLGLVYQYQHRKLLLQTGFNLYESFMQTPVDSLHVAMAMRDTEGIDFIYRGEVYERKDKMLTTELSIPLMLGVKAKHFYAVGGARVIFPLYAKTTQQALLTTKGDYGNRYYELFENMPQHGYFKALPVQTIGVAELPLHVNLCAEFGYSCLSKNSVLQIGAFVEYGLLNGLKDGNHLLTEVDCSQYMQVKMNHVYTTLSKEDHFVHPLFVGARISFLWNIAEKRNGGIYWELDGQNEMCVRSIGN